MTNCSEIKKLIPRLLADESSCVEAESIREHLKTCALCQQYAGTVEKSWEILNTWQDIVPQPGYVGKFWTRLAEKQAQPQVPRPQEVFLFKTWRPALVAVCLLFATGIFVGRALYHQQALTVALTHLSDDELEMVQNMELVENFDLIQDLDLFQDLEIIESIDAS